MKKEAFLEILKESELLSSAKPGEDEIATCVSWSDVYAHRKSGLYYQVIATPTGVKTWFEMPLSKIIRFGFDKTLAPMCPYPRESLFVMKKDVSHEWRRR